MDRNHAQASQTLLARILELHASGRTADEIAAQVLTTEPENAMFRAAMLVEIILHQISSSTEEKNQ
jgi:16S rRNA C1402 N4-methylase RsmH